MSRFLKCDCCGVEIDAYVRQSHIHIHDQYTEDGNYYSENLDLCPECTKKLQNFIYVLRNYPNNYVIHVTEEGDTNAN